MINYFTYFQCSKCDEYYHLYSVELDAVFVEASCPECGNRVVGIPENLEGRVPAATKRDLAKIESSFEL